MTKSSQQFQEQGGIATMDPSPLRRWVVSKVMTKQASERRMMAKRSKAENQRLKAKKAHIVEYFHQVDDPYSHLASQVLQDFCARYDIDLHIHIVTEQAGLNVSEPKLLSNLSIGDARAIAPYYGLDFPSKDVQPTAENITLAQAILASQDSPGLLSNLAIISDALWKNDRSKLHLLGEEFGLASESETNQKLEYGNTLRKKLQHYSGAMFYYAGEWYWGVDRLFHLEERLRALGTDKQPDKTNLAERPDTEVGITRDNGSLTLEIYASLRSPYTAIVFDRALKLAKDTGVRCVVHPVLPMVMRGVPATREKGLYILFDTAREARASGVPYGNVYDPIGQPARHGYALYDWACKFNKGNQLLSNFLRAAFVEGVNTNKNNGLRHVVERTGLDWTEAKEHLKDDNWQEKLEGNRLNMYNSGLWGVPSFRLLDKSNNERLAVWGQDRLWLIAKKIKNLLNE